MVGDENVLVVFMKQDEAAGCLLGGKENSNEKEDERFV